MGTSRTVAQFTAKIEKAGKELQKSDREILQDAGLLAKTTILVDVRRVVPDLRMSMGGKNAKVNVRYDFNIRESIPQVEVKAVGPLHLVENRTAPHEIPKVRRRRKVKTLRLPGGFRRTVNHPGTKGQQPFAKGRAKAERKVVTQMGNRTVRVVREVFR